MPDIVSPSVRSRMMAGIRGKDTKPEKIIRSGLHAQGVRFRLHVRDLPGKPDLVLPKYHAVIFVHGCFWHGHDCKIFKLPDTRRDFWGRKYERNRENDSRQNAQLRVLGWRIATIWECALKGSAKYEPDLLISKLFDWLHSEVEELEIRGRSDEMGTSV